MQGVVNIRIGKNTINVGSEDPVMTAHLLCAMMRFAEVLHMLEPQRFSGGTCRCNSQSQEEHLR